MANTTATREVKQTGWKTRQRERESGAGQGEGKVVCLCLCARCMGAGVNVYTPEPRPSKPPIASKRVFLISVPSRTSYQKQRTGPPRANRQPRLLSFSHCKQPRTALPPQGTMMKTSMLQSYQGPSDPMLRSNAVEGYTQVSRVGEQVINCFGTQPCSEQQPLFEQSRFQQHAHGRMPTPSRPQLIRTSSASSRPPSPRPRLKDSPSTMARCSGCPTVILTLPTPSR